MPTINFKGKSAVWNHHLSVPYQVLDKDKKMSIEGKNMDENLIIEGDNLTALKSLLPKYQGKIKCIYIDPPYNTGNEGWVYSDNVNSPLIKNWIGKSVGADDLTRHEKWLCMMTPRLKILNELLSDNGVIFISIDDNEQAHLKMLLDEIFNENNFESFIWKKKGGAGNTEKIIGNLTEYILCYFKYKKAGVFNFRNIERTYKFRDKTGPYNLEGIEKTNSGGYERKTMLFSIIDPKTKKEFYPQNGQRWTAGKETIDRLVKENRILFDYAKGRVYIIKRPEDYQESENVYYNLFLEKGSLATAKDELESLGFDREIFDTPKPSKLIKHILEIATQKDSLILDSFAGSGTTAQAVLELNKEDGGNRKFILVQLPEKIEKDTPAYKVGFRYIHEITQERVKRVIKRDKLDVGFSYFKLGSPIDAESILSGTLPTYKEFAKYVYYLATGETMDNEKPIDEKSYFAGKNKRESIYLIYQKDKDKLKNMAITLDWAEEISKKDKGKKIVYAPACFLDEEYLDKFNIQFVSVPYSLFEKK